MNTRTVTNTFTIAAVALVAILALATATAHAAFITPDAVTATSSYGTSPAERMIDSSGLSANTADATHTTSGTDGWMSNGPRESPNVLVEDEVLVFDLGDAYNLSQAYVWQKTESLDRNTRTMDIYVSDDNVTFTQVGGTVTLKESKADDDIAEIVPLSASNVQYVKFDILTAGSGNDVEYVGLNEVRFESTAIPEPSTAILAALGLLVLSLRRRRR